MALTELFELFDEVIITCWMQRFQMLRQVVPSLGTDEGYTAAKIAGGMVLVVEVEVFVVVVEEEVVMVVKVGQDWFKVCQS